MTHQVGGLIKNLGAKTVFPIKCLCKIYKSVNVKIGCDVWKPGFGENLERIRKFWRDLNEELTLSV